jgi:hypothetical protein
MSKQELIQFIQQLPDDITIDEVLYNLYVLSNVEAGLSDIKNGKTYTQSEIEGMFN